MQMDNFGFIITRHVNSAKTNKYWNNSIRCIRRFYPNNKIVIIDDNSRTEFLKAENDYTNVEIIQSEFPGRGELLPYYYYLKCKWFEHAVIIHDSIFFHRRINFDKLLGHRVLPLWTFEADKENITNTIRIANALQNNGPIKQMLDSDFHTQMFHFNDNKWSGCFGVQSFINHRFLQSLETKYKISNMIESVNCRKDRCSLERIFGAIFFKECRGVKSLFGNIMSYQKWGYTYDSYEADINRNKIPRGVVKVWTGR